MFTNFLNTIITTFINSRETSIKTIISIIIIYKVSIRFDNNRFVIYAQL